MRLRPSLRWVLHLLTLFGESVCLQDPLDDADLFSYISRPDLRPPKFIISTLDAAAITPGYWFVSPYNPLHAHTQSTVYQPLQMGPHIYDSQGELVWSGAHIFPRRAVYDFRVGGDEPQLTFVLEADMTAKELQGGAYVTLGQDYRIQRTLGGRSGQGITNIHEFKRVDGGSLVMTATPRYYLSPSYASDHVSGWLRDCGFQEIDDEGNPRFEWWALDHVKPGESYARHLIESNTDADKSWDFFHANSIDKTASGDYLLSARDTSTIYRISGIDGRILWRLGGKYSDFALPTMFSNQHDARVQFENTTTMVISLLDNAASLDARSSNTSTSSSAVTLSIDKVSWKATVLRSYIRPDHGFTRIRGNFQSLPGGASLAHWSDNNYFSEYDADGKMVLEAQLQSHRFESYRTYKFNWTSIAPVEEPAIKAFVYGTSPMRATMAMYVSWNGATNVATWRFYGIKNGSEKLIASVQRTKFETVAMADGYFECVRAKAFDASGYELGTSKVAHVELPSSWSTDRESNISHDLIAEQNISREGYSQETNHSSLLRSCAKSLAVVDLARSTCLRAIPYDGSMITLVALMALTSVAALALVRKRRSLARFGKARSSEYV